MSNVNVDFKVENLIKRFSIDKRKSIINIKSIESNYRINFAICNKIK